MFSIQPEASSCYLTEVARSMGAEVDLKPDTKNDSSDFHTSADTEPETPMHETSAGTIAGAFTEAENSPVTPLESPTDTSVQKNSEINPVESDDGSTKVNSKPHEETVSPPDLISVTEKLIGIPNDILKEHYGERIRFLAEADENAMIWSIKANDLLQPIAILTRTSPDGSLEVLRKDGKDSGDIPAGIFEARGEKLLWIGHAIQSRYACDHIGFYDGENIVLFTFYPDPMKGTQISVGWQDEVRPKLMTWLGEAIRKAKVKMLKPLTGYTLEDSNVEALGLSTPPQRFLNDHHIDLEPLFQIKVEFGGSKFKMYTTQDGKVVTVDNNPLPIVDGHDIATATGVRTSSQGPLIDLLILIGKEHVGDQLKYSYDLVADALVWYVRRPADRSKEFIGVLQFAAAGTIVPGDWGLRNNDLTFTNGEGIVRTAKPILEAMLALGMQHDCFSMVLFDYHNLVLVTRSKGTKVVASIALITGNRIRGALLQWLLRALEIAEDTYTSVS